MYNPKSKVATEFIDDAEILDTLDYAKKNKENRTLIESILERAKDCKGLSHKEAAVLLECEIPDLIDRMYSLAKEIKLAFYGNRIVMFAPLYLSNYCVNECRYCPYHHSNCHIARKQLTQEEIVKEVVALQDMGHKRLALETGEVDVIYQVETADVERLKANPDVHVEEKTSVENFYMPLNTAVAPFDDVNLRQAINCAIDRDAIIFGALNGYGTASYSAVPLGYEGAYEGNANHFDLEKAQEYLDAWGGDPSTVNLVILARTDENNRVATVIQDNLSKIGINVTIEQVDAPSWHARRASGDYIAGITSWSPSNCFTYLIRYDSSKAESIPGSLVDEQTDALIAEMKQTMDPDARIDVMHQIIDRVNELVPHISLWQGQYFRAWNSKLEGIEISATGYVKFHTARWTE